MPPLLPSTLESAPDCCILTIPLRLCSASCLRSRLTTERELRRTTTTDELIDCIQASSNPIHCFQPSLANCALDRQQSLQPSRTPPPTNDSSALSLPHPPRPALPPPSKDPKDRQRQPTATTQDLHQTETRPRVLNSRPLPRNVGSRTPRPERTRRSDGAGLASAPDLHEQEPAG